MMKQEPVSEQAVDEKKSAPAKTKQDRPKEIEFGGRDGLDPTRYGDWEKKGRCIDF